MRYTAYVVHSAPLGKMATISQPMIWNAFLYFDQNFTQICSYVSNWQYPSIGLDNGFQAIIWTNADPIHWDICAALGGDELTNR